MDEPSAVLTDRELDILFDVIDRLVKSGVTILYISHKFDEIFSDLSGCYCTPRW